MKTANLIKIVVISLVSLAFLAFFAFYLTKKPDIEIRDFVRDKDKQFISESINKDYYWLVENPNFSIVNIVDKISPNADPQYYGKLIIKVVFKDDKPMGFMTYYLKKFYEGKIQFVYVDPDHRGKGYAKTMVKYALKDLFNKGVSMVKLDTRVTNAPAIKIYTGLGFKQTMVDEERGIVSFAIQKQ